MTRSASISLLWIGALLELIASLTTIYVHFLAFPGGLKYAQPTDVVMVYALMLAGPLVVVLTSYRPKLAALLIPIQPLLIVWMAIFPSGTTLPL